MTEIEKQKKLNEEINVLRDKIRVLNNERDRKQTELNNSLVSLLKDSDFPSILGTEYEFTGKRIVWYRVGDLDHDCENEVTVMYKSEYGKEQRYRFLISMDEIRPWDNGDYTWVCILEENECEEYKNYGTLN